MRLAAKRPVHVDHKRFARGAIDRVVIGEIVVGGELDGAALDFDGGERGFELLEIGDRSAAGRALRAARGVPRIREALQVGDARGIDAGERVAERVFQKTDDDLREQRVGRAEQIGAAEVGVLHPGRVGIVEFLVGARLDALERLSERDFGGFFLNGRAFGRAATARCDRQKAAGVTDLGAKRGQKRGGDFDAIDDLRVVERVERGIEDIPRFLQAVDVNFVDFAARSGSFDGRGSRRGFGHETIITFAPHPHTRALKRVSIR